MQWSARPLTSDDAAAVAVVFADSRRAAMPWLPVLHTPDEDVAFFTAEVASSAGWGAYEGDKLVGFALMRDGWLNHLYVAPGCRGRGVGSGLLARVLAGSPGPVDLWVFERNGAALAFYTRHGFHVVERTDGSANEEREPDVRMRHRPSTDVRLARVEDAAALARVHVRSWQAAYAGIVDGAHLAALDVGARTELWRDRLTGGQAGALTYVATAGSDVVGFATAGPVRDQDLERQQQGWAEVYALYVDPGQWRGGVGSALWRALDAGWGEEVVAVALWVLRDNPRARAFYSARGLEPDGAERSILVGPRELPEVRMVIWR